MSVLKDWSQDGKIAALEQEADSSVDSIGTLATRSTSSGSATKVLAEVVEATLVSLGSSAALPGPQSAVLRKAMEPVKR